MKTIDQYKEMRRELDTNQLVREAKEKSGLSEFGDENLVDRLDKLLDYVSKDTDFHAQGLKEFRQEVLRVLVNRLRIHNDFKQHPEILEEDVSDPILIFGFPRSGTTKTLRMLGTDKNLLKTYMWQAMNPAPFPNAVPGQPDPRIAAARYGDFLAEGHPQVQAGHYFAAEEIDGDIQLCDLSFSERFHITRAPSSSWIDWTNARTEPSDHENYLYLHSLYQYLQWQQGGRHNRRYLIRHLSFTKHIEEVIKVFPKATLVHLHRHPYSCIPSCLKLVWAIWNVRIDNLDPKIATELMIPWLKQSIDTYLEIRDRLGLNDRIIDVPYEQIRNDPMPAFREIYRRAGHELTAEAEQGMLQWENKNEQGKHGAHVYSLEQFGLSEQKLDDIFDAYIRRFFSRPISFVS